MKQSFGLKPRPNLEEADRALRIAGGPGAGKTASLLRIYAGLLTGGVADGSRVLFLTATEPAARELRIRVDAALGQNHAETWIHSFQGFTEIVMREDPDLAFSTVLSGAQAHLVMRHALAHLEPAALGEYAALAPSDTMAADCLRLAPWLRGPDGPAEGIGSPGLRALRQVSGAYWGLLRSAGLCDFREVSALAREVLDRRPEVGRRFAFSHVLVDEFQDLDVETLAVLHRLAPPGSDVRLVVAGDADQSIFSFRGADPGQTLKAFDELWAPRVVELAAPLRSPALAWAAKAVLDSPRGNEDEPAPHLATQVSAIELPNRRQEADYIAREIRRLMDDDPGLRPDEVAVVVRSASAFEDALEEALEALAIPHRKGQASALKRNRLARHLLDCLESLARPEDSAALDRVLSSQLSGVGPALASRVRALADADSRELIPTLDAILSDRLGRHRLADAETKTLRRAADVRRERLARTRRLTLMDLVWSILGEPSMLTAWLDPEAGRRGERLAAEARATVAALADLDRIWSALNGSSPRLQDVFPRLRSWMASSLTSEDRSETGEREERVSILSVYEAKGRQFRVVFAAGMSRGLFPAPALVQQFLEPDDVALLLRQGRLPPWARPVEYRLAEEARMGYVALSRASERLYVTSADRYEEVSGPSVFWKSVARGAQGQTVASPGPQQDHALSRWEVEAALAGAELTPEQVVHLKRQGADLEFILNPAERGVFRPESARPGEMAVEVFSASALNTYLSCPRKYWYTQHPGWCPTPTAPATELGQHLHHVFEDFHRHEPEWSRLEPDDRRQWLWRRHRDLSADYLDALGDSLERKVRESYLDTRVGRYVEGILSPEVPLRRRTIATELAFQVDLDGHALRGKIDRLAETSVGIEVIDYKTGADTTLGAARKRYFGEEMHDVQLVAYHLACKQGVDAAGKPLGLEPALLSLWYPAARLRSGMRRLLFSLNGEIEGYDHRQQYALTEGELEHGRRVMLEAIEDILAGDFSPRPRPVAGTCRSPGGCPVAQVCPGARRADG